MSTLTSSDDERRDTGRAPTDGDAVAMIAGELHRLAESSLGPPAKAAFRRAHRALYQQSAGRPPTNDRKLLRDAAELLALGLAKSENDALTRVAATIATDHKSLKTIIDRLRRKRRKIIPGIG